MKHLLILMPSLIAFITAVDLIANHHYGLCAFASGISIFSYFVATRKIVRVK